MIARKKAKPMLIVMPLGYGNWEVIKGGWQRLREGNLWMDSINKFRDSLLNEVIPQVEKKYNVSRNPKSRAIAGLSMGGTQSLLIGLNAPEQFAWIGAFSSGGLGNDFTAQFPQAGEGLNSKFKLIWIGCGKQDGLIVINQNLVEWLKTKKVKHKWVETPGSHSFMVWRRYLAELTPLLFK
jgi:enterochelin esterase family protein